MGDEVREGLGDDDSATLSDDEIGTTALTGGARGEVGDADMDDVDADSDESDADADDTDA